MTQGTLERLVMEEVTDPAEVSKVRIRRERLIATLGGFGPMRQKSTSVSADMAHRLARVLNTTPDVWMNMQTDVDVWDALRANAKGYQKLKPLKVA